MVSDVPHPGSGRPGQERASQGRYVACVTGTGEQPSQFQLLDGDAAASVVVLGVVISHCAAVLQGDRLVRHYSETRPYFDASPASGDVYVQDMHLHEEPEYERWTNEFWSAISSLLTGAANLSKLFHGAGFGNNKKDPLADWKDNQRAMLRESLHVGPILGPASRSVRDALEHIDERLWQRLAAVRSGQADAFVVRHAFGWRDEWHEYVSEPPLGLYDPSSHTVYLVDQMGSEVSTDLGALVAEVTGVGDRAHHLRGELVGRL